MSQRPLSRAALVTLALVSFGCKKSGVECLPPPVVACPDGGGPSFEGEVLPIFQTVCANCHSPDAPAQDQETPFLTNYQQIYGPATGPSAGQEARAINIQVFYNCAMPPSTASVQLTDDQRQTLLEWLACGALDDSPSVDASAGD